MYASHFSNTNHVCRTVSDSKPKKRSNNDSGDVENRFGYLPHQLSHIHILKRNGFSTDLSAYPDICISQVQARNVRYHHNITAKIHNYIATDQTLLQMQSLHWRRPPDQLGRKWVLKELIKEGLDEAFSNLV